MSMLIERFFICAIRRSEKQANQPAGAANSTTYEPYIKHIYPPESAIKDKEVAATASRVPIFCFPDNIEELVRTHQTLTEDFNFTFVFTDVDGNQQFGVCRRIRPIKRTAPKKGSSLSLTDGENEVSAPEVLCILSKFNWMSFHFKLLEIIEERLLVSIQSVLEFVETIMLTPLPAIIDGKRQPFMLRVTPSASFPHTSTVTQNEYELVPPPDNSVFHDANFRPLFDSLSVENIMFLFSALMDQHRIIVISSSLTIVSSCIHILLALLYPFQWPYIYIPVLPRVILEYCMAPMPFLIGVHASSMDKIKTMDIEVVTVNLDEDALLAPTEDFIDVLPESGKLKQTLEKIVAEHKRSGYFNNQGIIEAFQGWYFQMFGTYRQFIRKDRDRNIVEFDKEEFIKMRGKASIKKFLGEFCQSQMFERFISKADERVHPLQTTDHIFEVQINSIGDHARIYDNTLSWSEKAVLMSEKAKVKYGEMKKKYYEPAAKATAAMTMMVTSPSRDDLARMAGLDVDAVHATSNNNNGSHNNSNGNANHNTRHTRSQSTAGAYSTTTSNSNSNTSSPAPHPRESLSAGNTPLQSRSASSLSQSHPSNTTRPTSSFSAPVLSLSDSAIPNSNSNSNSGSSSSTSATATTTTTTTENKDAAATAQPRAAVSSNSLIDFDANFASFDINNNDSKGDNSTDTDFFDFSAPVAPVSAPSSTTATTATTTTSSSSSSDPLFEFVSHLTSSHKIADDDFGDFTNFSSAPTTTATTTTASTTTTTATPQAAASKTDSLKTLIANVYSTPPATPTKQPQSAASASSPFYFPSPSPFQPSPSPYQTPHTPVTPYTPSTLQSMYATPASSSFYNNNNSNGLQPQVPSFVLDPPSTPTKDNNHNHNHNNTNNNASTPQQHTRKPSSLDSLDAFSMFSSPTKHKT